MVFSLCLLSFSFFSDGWTVDLSQHQIFAPGQIAITANDSVVIADNTGRRVLFFSGDGEFLKAFGSKGQGPGEFESIGGIFSIHDPHGVMVLDDVLGRVTIITLPTFQSENSVLSLSGMKVGLNQSFLDNQIVYTMPLEPKQRTFEVLNLETKETQPLYTYPREKHPGQSFDLGGRTIRSLYRWHPNHLFAVGPNVAVVANSGESKVTIIDLETGNALQPFDLTIARVPVTEADKEEAVLSAPKPYQSAVSSQISPPDFWPVLADIKVSIQDEVFAIGYGQDKIPVFLCKRDGTVSKFTLTATPSALGNGFAYVQVEEGDQFFLKKIKLEPLPQND